MYYLFEGRIKIISRQICISVVDTYKMDDVPNTVHTSDELYHPLYAATTTGIIEK